MYPFLNDKEQAVIDKRQKAQDEQFRTQQVFENLDKRAGQTFGDIKPYDFTTGWYGEDPLNPNAIYSGTPQTDVERKYIMDYVDRFGIKPTSMQVSQALGRRPYENQMSDRYAPGSTMYQLGYDTADQYFSTPGQGAGPRYAERQKPANLTLPKWQQPQYQEMPFEEAVRTAEPGQVYPYKIRDYIEGIQDSDSQILGQIRGIMRNPEQKGADVSGLVAQLSPIAQDYVAKMTGSKTNQRKIQTDETGAPIVDSAGNIQYEEAQTIKDYLFNEDGTLNWDYVNPGQLYFSDLGDYYNDVITNVDKSAKSGMAAVPYQEYIDQSPVGRNMRGWYKQFKNQKYKEYQAGIPKQKADWQKQVYEPAYQNYQQQLAIMAAQQQNPSAAYIASVNQNPAEAYQSWVMGSGYADSVKSWLLGNYDALLKAWDRSVPFMSWVMSYLTSGGRR